MIEITNYEVWGFKHAIRGMRNPMNSWELSDSTLCKGVGFEDCRTNTMDGCPRKDEYDFEHDVFCVGEEDMRLMKKLVKAGNDHSKFMRMITVSVDITAPLYWWKEFDTYKVGTTANSCSTMHKIHSKEFIRGDFSHAQMNQTSLYALDTVIEELNYCRRKFMHTNDKTYWYSMIQLLPASYNQKRTVQLNYAVLRNIYHSRKNHKLNEWKAFCEWVRLLPYYTLITD